MKIEIEYTLSDEEILIVKKIFLMKNEPEAVKELKGFYTEGNGEPIFKEDFFNAMKYSRPKTSIIIRFLLGVAPAFPTKPPLRKNISHFFL